MASLIRADMLGDDLEDKPVAEGKYDLRITSANLKQSKKGNPMIVVSMAVEGEENAASIFHYLNIPTDDDEPKSARFKARDLKRFLTVFNIPTDADIEEDNVASVFVGATGSCQVIQEEVQDANGNKMGEMRNVLRLPRIA